MSVGWVPGSVDVSDASVLVTGSGSGSVVVMVSEGDEVGETSEDTVTEGTASEDETPGVGSEETCVSVVV